MQEPKILTSIEDFSDRIPVNVDYSWKVILPFVLQAETSILKYYLGTRLMDDLPESVLSYAQDAVANFAFLAYIPYGQVYIGNSGISINSTEDSKTAFAWQINALKSSTQALAYQALENALEELEILDPADWQSSSYRKDMDGLLFQSAADFQLYYNIGSSRRTFTALLPLIRETQMLQLSSAIGDLPATKILAAIDDQNADLTIKQAIKLAKFATANYCIAKATRTLYVRITGSGISVEETSTDNNQPGSKAPRVEPLEALRSQVETSALQFTQRLQDLIGKNKALFGLSQDPQISQSATYTITNEQEQGIFTV